MDRGAWRATVYGVTRVGHDLVAKPPLPMTLGKNKHQHPRSQQTNMDID